jgi:ElaB/YqjD/DUF883 family membrane-anchored ribosome-binding protein
MNLFCATTNGTNVAPMTLNSDTRNGPGSHFPEIKTMAHSSRITEEHRSGTQKPGTAASVGQTLSEAASAAARKADDLASSAGAGMKNLGDTLRENAPRQGALGSATEAVASTLRDGGRYLEREGISGMMDDFGALVRNNPLPAICIGIGIGFLLGATLRR